MFSSPNNCCYMLSGIPDFDDLLCNFDENVLDNQSSCQTLTSTCYTTKSNKNYNIIQYDKSLLNNDLIQSYGLLRSVIANSAKRVVCFSPPKSLKSDNFISINPVSTNIVAEEFIEGTMINVFWDDADAIYGGGNFEISTRKTVGADVAFFKNGNGHSHTFKSMFLEAAKLHNLNIDTLNPAFCYSFVLQHPENRIVLPISVPQLYLVAVYRIAHFNGIVNVFPIDLNEVKMNGNWGTTTVRFPKTYTGWNTYSELIDQYASPNTPYYVMGVIIKNVANGTRCKIRNPIYEEVRQLRGNQPKLQYQYLTLRQQGTVSNFLSYYPEMKQQFSSFRDQLHIFTNTLFRNYISCYVKKERPLIEFPPQYRSYMFDIHMKYINDLKPNKLFVNNKYVIEYINGIPPARQMYSINFNLRKNAIDNNIIQTNS